MTDKSTTDNSDRSRTDNSTSLTDNSTSTGTATSSGVFGDGALVASSTLSSYVTGVRASFTGARGGAAADNGLTVRGNSFQNFSGLQALNQNTGVGASQNAAVNVAVSTRDIRM